MTLVGYGSSRDLLMMEKPSVIDAFFPNNRVGLQIGGPVRAKRLTWNAGVFSVGQTVERGDASDSPLRIVSRVTGLPWFQDEEGLTPGLLHLGLAVNYTFSGTSGIRYRARPESNLSPFLVDTGDISAQSAILVGTELAWMRGPFSVQAEYVGSFVDSEVGEEADFFGAYLDVKLVSDWRKSSI